MLPYAELLGDPYEQGRAHGQAAAGRIATNVRVYRRRFTAEAGLTPAEIRSRSDAYWGLIEADEPDYAAGVRGIADGSGVPLSDVVTLNVRYEILYSRLTELLMEGRGGGASECTSFAVDTSRGLLLGQNWDWIPDVLGLVVRIDGAVPALAFTEAGIFGAKIGLNAAGVGLAVNGLASSGDDWERLGTPFHVRTWRALHSATLGDAVGALTAGEHACSANFMVGQAGGGAVDVETSPEGVCTWQPEDDRLVHTNHFLAPGRLGVTEPENPRRRYSIHRRDRLSELLAAGGDPEPSDLMAHMRDHDGHPNSVCRHPNLEDATGRPPYQTVTSAIMDLTSKVLWLTDGPPCQAEYQRFQL